MSDEQPRDEAGRYASNADMNAMIRAAAGVPPQTEEGGAPTEVPAIAGLDGGAGRGQRLDESLDANAGMNFLIRRQSGRYVGSLGTYSNGLARTEP